MTHNGRQLLFTLLMTSCVVFIYTIIAFKFFREFYVDGDTDKFD